MPPCYLFPSSLGKMHKILRLILPFARTRILLKFGNTIWRDEWISIPSNMTGVTVVSRLPGSNKMSCFPFRSLMPLRASFSRSLMCHSEIAAQTILLISRLLANNRTPHPHALLNGETHIEMSFLFHPLPSFSNQSHSHVLTAAHATAAKQVLKRVPYEPALTQPRSRALDPDLFKWSSLYHNRLRAAAALD